jgi:hypothetical protein
MKFVGMQIQSAFILFHFCRIYTCMHHNIDPDVQIKKAVTLKYRFCKTTAYEHKTKPMRKHYQN